MTHLYDPELTYFYKLITVKDGGVIPDKTIDSSSFYGVFRFGVLSVNDPMLSAVVKTAERELTSPIGGIVRYVNDRYYEADPSTPGNPWVVTTLWLAEYYIARATCEEDFEQVKRLFCWVADRALPSYILSEQFHPRTGEQLSVAPLTWSHAAYVTAVTQYLRRLEELGISPTCYPIQ
jgi:GH15 family glucan-1,4-alpha-glucosidase